LELLELAHYGRDKKCHCIMAGFALLAADVGPHLYRKVRKNSNDKNNGNREIIHNILLGRGFSACIQWDSVHVIAVAFLLLVLSLSVACPATQLCGLQKKTQPWMRQAGRTLRRLVVLRKETEVSASEDQAEVEKVLAGDFSAFEGVVRRWQAPLINLAYRFFRDRSRAEEMAQEAFLRAYRGLKGWRKDAAFSTWLFALATNLYCSELRRTPPSTLPLDEVLEPTDPHGASSGFDEGERAYAVRQAVFALPAKYRDVLILFYFQEMDVPTTAATLGLPEGTVKARLSRGRDVLRNKLQRLAGPPGLEPVCKEGSL
jgi:RNA polymerase sigma-70 factor (ECF subfamily)